MHLKADENLPLLQLQSCEVHVDVHGKKEKNLKKEQDILLQEINQTT